MEKNQHSSRGMVSFLVAGLIFGVLFSGCAPSYPKEQLVDSLVRICQEEYSIDVQAQLLGKTIVVFIPLNELFDAKLDILPEAVEKIENVILTTSRVLFSTDADVDFYTIIAADIKTTTAQVILVRYMDDVYKFMHGWIKRDEYRKRILWEINFNPKLLNYSEFDFDIDEMTLPVFLVRQISQRLGSLFDATVVYKTKMRAAYEPEDRRFVFFLVVADTRRFENIYVPVILQQTYTVLHSYHYDDYRQVRIINQFLGNSLIVEREELSEYGKVDIDALLTLPVYD